MRLGRNGAACLSCHAMPCHAMPSGVAHSLINTINSLDRAPALTELQQRAPHVLSEVPFETRDSNLVWMDHVFACQPPPATSERKHARTRAHTHAHTLDRCECCARGSTVPIAVNMSNSDVHANFEAIRRAAGWKAEYAQFQGMRMGVKSLDEWLGYLSGLSHPFHPFHP